MKWLLVVLFVIWLFPMTLSAGMTITPSAKHAAAWKGFNEAVDDKIQEIKALVFGPITRICGMLGIAVGVFYLMQGKTQHMMTWAGIGILLSILPTFIDSI